MNVVPSVHFSRVYKKYFSKLNNSQKKEIENNIDLFIGNPFLPQFRTHKLTTGEWSATILKDADRSDRIIFARSKDQIILLTIGSHDEVY